MFRQWFEKRKLKRKNIELTHENKRLGAALIQRDEELVELRTKYNIVRKQSKFPKTEKAAKKLADRKAHAVDQAKDQMAIIFPIGTEFEICGRQYMIHSVCPSYPRMDRKDYKMDIGIHVCVDNGGGQLGSGSGIPVTYMNGKRHSGAHIQAHPRDKRASSHLEIR